MRCSEQLGGMKLDFIGDSRARNIFDAATDIMSQLNLTFTTNMVDDAGNQVRTQLF